MSTLNSSHAALKHQLIRAMGCQGSESTYSPRSDRHQRDQAWNRRSMTRSRRFPTSQIRDPLHAQYPCAHAPKIKAQDQRLLRRRRALA
jgi:hypothetical protein